MLALAKCMRANGVPNFPDPGGNGGGIQVPKLCQRQHDRQRRGCERPCLPQRD